MMFPSINAEMLDLLVVKHESSDSDADSPEINQLILTADERKLKTIIWNNLNKDWIKEQHEKKRKKKEERKQKLKNNKLKYNKKFKRQLNQSEA